MNRSTLRLLSIAIIAAALFLANSSAFSADKTAWEASFKDEPFIRLLHEVVVKVNKDYTSSKTEHVIDRIQTEGGKKLGEISIYYDQKREEVKDIEAFTITPDGKKIRADKIQDINDPNNFGVYSDQRKKIISMPNVVVGSIIDRKETTILKRPIIEKNYYDSFSITQVFPVKEARYKLIAPRDMKLNIKNLNTDIEPRIEYAGDEAIYSWDASEVEKIEYEEYMPSLLEIDKRITVSSLSDWKQLAEWVWSLNKKNMKISPDMKQKATEITKGRKTTSDKIQAIIEYLQKEFRYVSMNINSHGYEPHPADEVYANRYGDCKDQTLLAVSMLAEIGVKASPVLFSTWADLNRDDLLPMPSFFDHVILHFEVDGRGYYTDVLQKGYRFQEIPSSLAKKKVFVVNDRGGYFSSVPEEEKIESATIVKQDIAIRNDGTAVVDVDATFSRGISIKMRETFKNLSEKEKEKVYAGVETQIMMGGKMVSRAWKNIDVPHSLIVFNIRFEHPNLVQIMGDMMMFGMPQTQRGSLFSAPKRKYPIVYKSGIVSDYQIAYNIPAGYEVLSLPKKVILETDLAQYRREYSLDSKGIIRARQLNVYKHGRVPAGDYKAIQAFYDAIPKATNDKIVIKKKANIK
jgi:hypothetical protein